MSKNRNEEPSPPPNPGSNQVGLPGDAALEALIRRVAEQVVDEKEAASQQPFWKSTPILAVLMGVIVFLGGRLGIDNLSDSPHAAHIIHDALGTEIALSDNIDRPENQLGKKILDAVDKHISTRSGVLTDLISKEVRNRPFMAFHGRHVFGPKDFESDRFAENECPEASDSEFIVLHEEFSECEIIRVTEFDDSYDMPFFAKPHDSISILLALENKRLNFRTFNVERTRLRELHEGKIVVSVNGTPVQLERLNTMIVIPSLSTEDETDYMLFRGNIPAGDSSTRSGDSVFGAPPRLRFLEVLASSSHPRDHFTGAAIIVLVNHDEERVAIGNGIPDA